LAHEHVFRFLRQEGETDVFYCESCLNYRRVEALSGAPVDSQPEDANNWGAPGHEPAIKPDTHVPGHYDAPAPGVRVLVVDDDPGVNNAVAEILRSAGYVVDQRHSAEDLVEHVRATRPHTLLLDLAMPGKNGLEALVEVKQEPETADVPVIVFSAFSVLTTALPREARDVEAIVRKPANIDELLQHVARAVAKRL
jgi:CheY-like chemotaxis protein